MATVRIYHKVTDAGTEQATQCICVRVDGEDVVFIAVPGQSIRWMPGPFGACNDGYEEILQNGEPVRWQTKTGTL